MNDILSLLFSLIGVVIVLVLTVYGSKWLIKKQSLSIKSKHIKIIDRVMLGQDKSIIVAEICNSKYIIGVSGQQITLLKELGELQLEEITSDSPADFSSIFGELLKKQIDQVKDRFHKKGEDR